MSADTPEQKRAASRKQIRKMKVRKAAGLCTVCGLPAAPGCSGACEPHRVARNNRTYDYRKRRLASDPAYREAQRLKSEASNLRQVKRNALARELRETGALLALCQVFRLELPHDRTAEATIRVLRAAGRSLVAAMGTTHRPGVRKPKAPDAAG